MSTRYITRLRSMHESLAPKATDTDALTAFLTEMQSFSRIICATWEPHIEQALLTEAQAALKNGTI